MLFRSLKTLTQFAEYFGEDRLATTSREISKIYEDTKRGTLSQLVEHFTKTDPRGEFVIVVSGKETKKENKKTN